MKLFTSNRYLKLPIKNLNCRCHIDIIGLILLLILVLGLFKPFWRAGKLPIPSDALVGMYHPWRDALKPDFPNGYPVKNPLITDPVRQQYVYRYLAIEQLKKGQLPVWNPYAFAGTPLLANIQTTAFYPLNFLFWLFEFPAAWSILVMLQPLLAGWFMLGYLSHLKLDKRACFLGSLAWAFSGFMIAWLEWNTIGQVALWLPLILWSIDNLVKKFHFTWVVMLTFSQISMLLAGHAQTAFYVLGFTTIYLLARIWQKYQLNIHQILNKHHYFLPITIVVMLLISRQWLATGNFIKLSTRSFDLPDWHRSDWFIPWQHLLQFIAPDFFGNPTTGNYWGVWNYGEFIGYVGLIPLILAFFGLSFRKDKKTLFFGIMLFISLFLGLPTLLAKLPYQLSLPLISTMQPSRIMVLIDFCLCVLAALGLDYFIKTVTQGKQKIILNQMIKIIGVFIGVFGVVWIIILLGKSLGLSADLVTNVAISKRNFVLTTILLVGFIIYLTTIMVKPRYRWVNIITFLLLLIVVADSYRFAAKFTPFTDRTLLYPETKSLNFLKNNVDNYRIMTTDRRILPPNVSTIYKLQSVDGYDPLYLLNYGELVAAWTRDKPDIKPAAFNRIITPEKYDSFMTDLLGVKYILSREDLTNPKLELVFQEGDTRVYQNQHVFPRVFLVEEVIKLDNQQQVIEAMFKNQQKLTQVTYTNEEIYVKPIALGKDEEAKVISYTENKIMIKTNVAQQRLLVLTDIYYLDWQVFINGRSSSIFQVDYCLRGVIVPQGESRVEFRI